MAAREQREQSDHPDGGETDPHHPSSAPAAVGSGGGKQQSGRFAYDGLQRVIHERSRLSILSSLAQHPEGLLFNDLKVLCNLTDGNLSRQLQLLQEGSFVEVWKGFKNNRPQTLVRLTEPGRERFLEYISVLESVVADAMTAARQNPKAAADEVPDMRRVAPA
jgi:DNA-binding MarR family transcriptional regulator